jgi:hypothetical protein
MEAKSPNQFDLNKPPKGYKVEIKSNELPEELKSRLWRECGDAWIQWGKEAVLFLSAIAGVGTVVLVCYRIIASPGAGPEDKKWAMSVLASIVGGIVGYLIRGKSGK